MSLFDLYPITRCEVYLILPEEAIGSLPWRQSQKFVPKRRYVYIQATGCYVPEVSTYFIYSWDTQIARDITLS
jgi:hypothetical protein